MHPRAAALIDSLELRPHPEGGFYREVYRSADLVTTASGAHRAALTSIYFLLVDDGFSRWHRVLADEAWHFHEGDPLELHWGPCGGREMTHALLAPVAEYEFGSQSTSLQVVPAGCWQAAVTTGDYTLVGCTVGPGFDFADLRMLADEPEEARRILERFPGGAAWL